MHFIVDKKHLELNEIEEKIVLDYDENECFLESIIIIGRNV